MSCLEATQTTNKNSRGGVNIAGKDDAIEEGASLLKKIKRNESVDSIHERKQDDKNDDSDDDEVMIVSPPADVSPVKTTGTTTTRTYPRNQNNNGNGSSSTTDTENDENDNDDDEIQVTGTVNALSLPHMRCHCTVYPFQPVTVEIDLTADDDGDNPEDKAKLSKNAKSCDLCFCYICDAPVKECTDWKNHCDATDKSNYWTNVRKRKRSESRPASLVASLDDGRILKWLIECIRVTSRKGYFHFDEEGMVFTARHDLLEYATLLVLPTQFFQEYECVNPPVDIGISDFLDIITYLKGVKKKDGPVTIKGTPKEIFSLSLGNPDGNRHRTAANNVREPLELFLDHDIIVDENIPAISTLEEQACTVYFELDELKHVLRVMDGCSDYLTITFTKEKLLQFSLVKPVNEGSYLEGAKYTFKNVDLRWNEETSDSIDQTVSLDDMVSLVGKVPLSLTRDIRIGVRKDMRVELGFDFKYGGRMLHFLPHIDERDR